LDSLTNSSGTKQYAIMHRDLKPANILFHDGKVKIVDFGFGKIVSAVVKEVKMKQTFLGTPLYICPQILEGEAYSFKCDIWSAGCVIFESIFGVTPWTARTEVELLEKIKKEKIIFPAPVGENTQDLLKLMLQVSEEKRLDWVGITKHKAVEKL